LASVVKQYYCNGPSHMTTRFQPIVSHMVSAKQLLHLSNPMCCKPTQLEPCQTSVYECCQQQTMQLASLLTKFEGDLQQQYFCTWERGTVLISERKWLVYSHTI